MYKGTETQNRWGLEKQGVVGGRLACEVKNVRRVTLIKGLTALLRSIDLLILGSEK